MQKESLVGFDDVPVRRFHLRVVFSASGGQFSDGFILGTIGIALVGAKSQLSLNSLWVGVLGAATLAGLFFGSLLVAPLLDRIGRRPFFVYDMAAFLVLAALQFWVSEAWQLLVLRLAMGLVLGFDYVTTKTIVAEFVPRRARGRLGSVLGLAWVVGYVFAYLVGYLLKDTGPDGWRWTLAAGAVPPIIAFFARLSVPESPLWLLQKGRLAAAEAVVSRIGSDARLPEITRGGSAGKVGFRGLFEKRWRTRTIVACVFYACHILPYFALGTFAPQILESLNVHDSYLGGAIYNILLLIGTLMGFVLIDRLSRRVFVVGSFILTAAVLAPLAVSHTLPTIIVIGLFALVGCALAAADNLSFVYPTELFTTDRRAAGVGLALASSRAASACSTFLLPIVVDRFGVQYALGACAASLLIGGVVCFLFGPETRGTGLATADAEQQAPGTVPPTAFAVSTANAEGPRCDDGVQHPS